jgi:hypothetical protein
LNSINERNHHEGNTTVLAISVNASEPGETPQSLLTTWEMSLKLLGGIGEDATQLQDILTLFAFFHHARISERIFTADLKLIPDVCLNGFDYDVTMAHTTPG